MKEQKRLFANSAPAIIHEACSYIQDLLATALNSLFSIFAIAFAVSGDLLASYTISLAGCLVYTWWFSSRATQRSERTEASRVALVSHADGVWPALTLKNRAFDKQWRATYLERFTQYLSAARAEAFLKNGSSLALSVISVAPTAALLIWLFQHNIDEPEFLAALLVTSPRAFQLLMMLGHFSSLAFEFHHLRGRLTFLKTIFDEPEATSRPQTGNAVKASWGDREWDLHESPEEFFETLGKIQSGRIAITGPNGSGKTTLLLKLKGLLGDHAVYLPAQALNPAAQTLSSGERKVLDITSALSWDDARCLLLDEWDANLDHANRARIDTELQHAARSRLIIEVRHRPMVTAP